MAWEGNSQIRRFLARTGLHSPPPYTTILTVVLVNYLNVLKVIHRVNTIEGLKSIPTEYGVEVDLKARGDKIILNHEAFSDGDDFEEYLKEYKHKLIILNIKEAGIESRVLELMERFGITEYFLLDVEHPYLYSASQRGMSKMAVRYSEYEPIELAMNFNNGVGGKVDWIWIDTVSDLPLDEATIAKFAGFKTCLVCPERWGRPEDIAKYAEQMKAMNFEPTAVMTALKYVDEWNKYYS